MAGVRDNTLTSVKEGSIVNFKTVAQTPLKSLRVNFNPIQQGEGDPSPENIRAISGWTGVNVYNGTTIPVSWSDLGTVYGGYVDLISGEIWKTFWQYTFTGEQTFYTSGNWVVAYILPVDSYYPTAATPWQGVCSHYPYAPYGRGKIGVMYNERACTFDGSIYDAAGWKQYCADQYSAGTPVQIAYRLKNPQLIGTIDPITIKSLIGTNNIYSDADSVSIEYYNLESLNLYKQRFKANQPYLQTVSGSVASFQTALKAPLKECKVYFSPVQAEGTPSPDNVLPILGWTGFDLYTAGKNILPHGNFTRTTNGITYNLKDDGSLTINGQSTGNAWLGVPESLYFRLPINTYTLSGNTLGYSATGYRHYMVATQVDGHSLEKYDFGSGITFTPDYAFDTARLQAQILSNKTISNKTVYPQLEVGSEATEFEEPVTKKSSITFPSSAGTVYGGYVDLVTGEIWGTWYKVTIDETVPMRAYFEDFRNVGQSCSASYWLNSGLNAPKASGYIPYSTNGFCNILPYLQNNYAQTDKAAAAGSTCDIGLSGTRPKADFLSWLAENGPVEIAYRTAEPFLIGTINPITIKTLKGVNNIWSNTNGNIQTKYWTYGSLAKRKTFTWNQWVVKPSNNTWISSTSNFNVTYNDDNIEIEFLTADAANYAMSIRQNVNNVITTYANHIYYGVCHIYPSYRGRFSMTLPGGIVSRIYYEAKQWSKISGTSSRNTDDTFYTYLPYPEKDMQIGDTVLIKAPMLIDLTQMFGAGNQPTKEEFESLCARNGIDLTQYQPYDEGSTVNWYV